MADNEVVEKSAKELYDEKKREREAQRAKEAKKELKKQEKSTYRNPIKSIWGKVIIWILCFAMVATIIFGLISLIVKNF